MHDDSERQLKMLAARTSTLIKNKLLSHAYVVVTRNGLLINVKSIDGHEFVRDLQHDPSRINVEVQASIVRKAWIG